MVATVADQLGMEIVVPLPFPKEVLPAFSGSFLLIGMSLKSRVSDRRRARTEARSGASARSTSSACTFGLANERAAVGSAPCKTFSFTKRFWV